ncbi:MAG: acetylxylan esterase [Pirellulaceae bacterium]|nr:acetylxylan esterase [Pirellulaceae bacterium]
MSVCALYHFAAMADSPTVLNGATPNDQRLEPLRHLDSYFPFQPPSSEAEWNERRDYIRRHMQVAVGLWPLPTRMPLNAVIHGKQELDDYTIEKVYFESMPGFYVTGNLYRPVGKTSRVPGILCPHGHWPNGRFFKTSPEDMKRELEQGAEQFEQGGQSPLQARCVQLARMGCVVFHYDMLGSADSVQFTPELVHGFRRQRPEANTGENWGLYSPAAESHSQSMMGLQTYNSIRALDFISELPDVDTDRLAVTGASGGGTQTFLVCALDDRPAVSFPAVMVSTAMQGGCTCENSCLLRIGTGNVEFAAMFAPKPLMLSTADDWTVEMSTKGFPELQKLYQLLGRPDDIALVDRTEFKHNYNSVSRHAMYHWFNQYLDLQVQEPIQERDYKLQSDDHLTVWNKKHPQPTGGFEFEQRLLRWWHDDSQRQLAKLTPHDEASMEQYRQTVGGALDIVIGRQLPAPTDIVFEKTDKQDHSTFLQMPGLLRNKPHNEELPCIYLDPSEWNGQVVIWLDPAGKACLWHEQGKLQPGIQRLLDAGSAVVGVDLLMQGEFVPDGKAPERTRRVELDRESAAYTFGYNAALFARRVHDVLTVISFVRHQERTPKEIALVGIAGAGHWAAAACAQAKGTIDLAAIDTQGFRFASIRDLHHPDFLPGGAKYGDLPGMLAVGTPTKLWLTGEDKQSCQLTVSAYAATGNANGFMLAPQSNNSANDVVNWLLSKS